MITATDRTLPETAEHALARGLDALGLSLSPDQHGALMRYVMLLEKWNRVYNLTAVRELERMVSHHLLDSLAVLPHIAAAGMLDVGSGAGLPGIPLAIARPLMRVTLIDSNHKKAAFMQQAIGELALQNAQALCERVERWQTPQRFELIVSRAFAQLSEFVEQAGQLLAPGGVLMAMKGVHPFEEIARLPCGYRLRQVVRLTVPGLDAERHLVFVEAAAT